MKKFVVTLVVNLNNDMDADWIADAVQDQLERGEDLLSFEVEKVGQHETRRPCET